jgi:hypothetical protein
MTGIHVQWSRIFVHNASVRNNNNNNNNKTATTTNTTAIPFFGFDSNDDNVYFYFQKLFDSLQINIRLLLAPSCCCFYLKVRFGYRRLICLLLQETS